MVHRLIAILVCSAGLLGGCASVTHVQAGHHDQFRNVLVQSCQSIQNGEFDLARNQLDRARYLANGSQQQQKVTDLEHMLDGGRFLNDGKPGKAASEWLAIRDAGLRKQVQSLASSEGIDLIMLARNERMNEENAQ